jgi:hypothetical protein
LRQSYTCIQLTYYIKNVATNVPIHIEFLLDNTEYEIELITEIKNDKYLIFQQTIEYINIQIKRNPTYDNNFSKMYNLFMDTLINNKYIYFNTNHPELYYNMIFKYKFEHNKILNIKNIRIKLIPHMQKNWFYNKVYFESNIIIDV